MFKVGDHVRYTVTFDDKGRTWEQPLEGIIIEIRLADARCKYEVVHKREYDKQWYVMNASKEEIEGGEFISHLSREEMLLHPHLLVRELGL